MSVYSTIGNVARRRTHCPRCDVALSAVRAGELMLAGCKNCRGVWIDRKVLEKISKGDSKARRFGAARDLRGNRARQNLKCPICYYWMDVKNFENCAELEVDVCRRHGTWLDAGEVRAILMFGREEKGTRSENTPAPHPGPLPGGEGESSSTIMAAKPIFRSTALPVGAAVVAAGSAAASEVLKAPNSADKSRSALEGGAEMVLDLVEFVGEVVGEIDFASVADLGEVVSCVAEIGFSLLEGLG